ncbi:hypothetical protein V6N13_058754 [Hibiscus sabdariffa]|uniref:Uncharacterized protein n=1 Tax=Hibiscus sabdariffa TaxID=183260 RepID=A0ABR2GF55_9ROSI
MITVNHGTTALKLEDGTSQQGVSNIHSSLMQESIVSYFENLKQVPHFEHFQNTISAFVLVLAKFKRDEKLKYLRVALKMENLRRLNSFMNLLFWYSIVEDLQEVLKTWEEYMSEENRLSTKTPNIVVRFYV